MVVSALVLNRYAENLTEILTNIHKGVVLEVTQRSRAPTKYKRFEPYKIRVFFESYDSAGKPGLDIAAETLSTLLRAHLSRMPTTEQC